MIMHLEDITELTRSDPELYKPWPFSFASGDKAWALGANERWRLVTICEVNAERLDEQTYVVYTASWEHDGCIMRGTFCPLAGDLKPTVLITADGS